MLNLAVIGTGRIGQLHARNLGRILRNTRLAVVADPDLASARICAADSGALRATSDIDSIFSDREIDAVVICSPTTFHADQIIAAAENGKHVICEKPIAHDLQTIDSALSAVEHAGVKLQIGFNRRFDANFMRVRDAVSKGEIGDPHLLHIISRDPAPPSPEYIKDSGGLFLDMTIHDFDMARYLIGSDVTEVFAAADVRVDPEIKRLGDVDTALIFLRFANGVLGTIDNSRKAVYGYDQRVEVFGSAGNIRSENNYPNAAVVSSATCISRDLPLNFFLDRYADSYLVEMRQFVDAVLEDTQTPVSGADGRHPVVIARAASLSYRENRPVRLGEVDDIIRS